MTFVELLPMIVYILLIVLLIVLIVLGIKLIMVVDKTDKLMADIQEKVSSFNTVFSLISLTSDKLTSGITTIVDNIIGLFKRIFNKREEEDYE